MSSLPLISHHLFVEAASQESPKQPRPTRSEKPSVVLRGIATALPLELLDPNESLPAEATRPLRASTYPGGT